MTIDLSLIGRKATDILDLLRTEAITPLDLLQTLEARIERVEPQVNALPTLCWERARAAAERLMALPVAERGLLCGMPVPIKDLSAVAGVRTTYGSRIHAQFVPELTDDCPARLEESGAILYAKSNTPEFGAGGHTFNDVFGMTRNPWNLSRSAGGSSGGAAASLASGTSWVAQGSDLAGSLRTPAAFCGVVGLRPSLGLVPNGPRKDPFDTLSVNGPMARNVADTALLLDAMVGTTGYLAAAQHPGQPTRIAWSPGLGIAVPEPEIEAICLAAMDKLAEKGVDIDHPAIDFSAAGPAFAVLRGIAYATNLGEVFETHRALLKPDVVANIEFGLSLDAAAIAQARRSRGQIHYAMLRLLDSYDVVISPAAIVPAFPVEETYVRRAAGRDFETYFDWLAIAYALTMAGSPVVAIPCGMTADGLPVGIQIAGRPGGEAALLKVSAWIEAAIGNWATREPQTGSLTALGG